MLKTQICVTRPQCVNNVQISLYLIYIFSLYVVSYTLYFLISYISALYIFIDKAFLHQLAPSLGFRRF